MNYLKRHLSGKEQAPITRITSKGNIFAVVVIISILSTNVFAEQAPMDLVEHANAMAAIAVAKKLKESPNLDKGYLVQIEGERLVRKGTDYYLYQSQARVGGRPADIVLLSTKEFDLTMEQVEINGNQGAAALQRISREGGGNYNNKPLYRIYALAVPKGYKDYVTLSGSKSKTFAFEVVQICSSSDFKKCRKIKE